ncbi:hypothetical protein D9M70_354990 [compost metagenome]
MPTQAVPQQHQPALWKVLPGGSQEFRHEVVHQVPIAVIQLAVRPRAAFPLAGPVRYQYLVAGGHQAQGERLVFARGHAKGRQQDQHRPRYRRGIDPIGAVESASGKTESLGHRRSPCCDRGVNNLEQKL